MNTNTQRVEALGPAERIISTLLANADHMMHNRPGIVSLRPGVPGGVEWKPVTHKVEDGQIVVYRLDKVGKKTDRARIGVRGEDGQIREGGHVIGRYQAAGLFPEIVAYLYEQVAAVWQMDNEFAARWASYAFAQEHRDLKVVLTAFMLVQNRCGDPIMEDGKLAFHDDDFRAVGEAMCLIRRKDGKDLNPKLLLRVGEVLALPQVTDINRRLGFGRSMKNPAMGRWPKAVEKWLRHREQNPKMMTGLVKAGFRTTIIGLCQRIGFKPETPAFFQTLRWKQKQAVDGRRQVAIGMDVSAAETWGNMTEGDICQTIVKERPSWKRLTSLIPPQIGVTRAIMAAAIESGGLSDKDMVILTPTLEELGLLDVADIKRRWENALKVAEDQRAANIARNVKGADVAEKLAGAAEKAAQKAVEEVMRGLVLYIVVDKSGSMQGAIAQAKECLTKLLPAFPPDKLFVSVFNTVGSEISIKHRSAAGVEQAFRSHMAGGGTDYASGVIALGGHKPGPNEDAVFIFVGDQGQYGQGFMGAFDRIGFRPVAFGLMKVPGENGTIVEDTARNMGIPCFPIDTALFDGDPYVVPRTLRNLIATTPVSTARAQAYQRESLVETILKTEILQKPIWT